MIKFSTKVMQKFWTKVSKQSSGCWLWIGGCNGKGRPVIYYGGGQIYAHRLAYQALVGPIPKGMLVCPTCDCKVCVNPKHLFVGTQADNMQDMRVKGRANHPIGETNGRAKLTEAEVKFIRTNYLFRHPKWGQTALAKRYGVCVVTIQDIVHNRSWRHL